MFKSFIKINIRFYQLLISPLLGNCCRFYPSCSEYALIAYKRFGFFKATKLTIIRLFSCGSWHRGGIDMVPERK